MNNKAELLNQAISFHKSGDENKALLVYQQILKDGSSPAAALNASAILRKAGSLDNAKKILVTQLLITPQESGLWHNLARVEIDIGDFPSSLRSCLKSISLSQTDLNVWLCFISVLCHFELYSLALSQIRYIDSLSLARNHSDQIKLLTVALDVLRRAIESGHPWQEYFDRLSRNLLNIGDSDKYSLSDRSSIFSYVIEQSMHSKDISRAQNIFSKLEELIVSCRDPDQIDDLRSGSKQYHNAGWNLGIYLIKHCMFEEGWKLYDHGLRVPAAGPQRWQRALRKPFSSKDLPLWDGSDLTDKSILVISEQAVGDSIMFFRSLPFLFKEAKEVTLLVNPRLKPLYQNSVDCKIYSDSKELPDSKHFDFQVPVGSLLQYRIPWIKSIRDEGLNLVPNQDIANRLKSKIRRKEKYLVGLSWSGGVLPKRKRVKSVDFTAFADFLNLPNCDFVSLQYGNVRSIIEESNKVNPYINYLEEVNPLKDMETWLSLVSLCDFVITVANTTVHGASSLGIPTFTLVPHASDWRWLDPEVSTESYWYNSVHPYHQPPTKDWSEPISRLKTSIKTYLSS